MGYAREMFDKITEPNMYLWNTMMKGYSRIGRPRDAVSMYLEMLGRGQRPDNHTFPFLLKGFTRSLVAEYGKELHGHVVKFGFGSNVFVQNAMIHMYSMSGQTEIARVVFEMSSKRDVIAWNILISAYNRSKQFDESRRLFVEMEMEKVLPTSVTFVLIFSACSKLKDLETGKRVHQRLKDSRVEPNTIVGNALIDMYATCGEMDSALEVFETMKNKDMISWTAIVKGFAGSGQIDLAQKFFNQMPEKDCVTWTAMIDGFVRTNRFKEALALFRSMQLTNVKPDEFTMVGVLTACAQLGALGLGEWIKTYMDKKKIKQDIFVGNALVDMYFKCGSVDRAVRVFNEMPKTDRFTWTTVIVGLAINGHGEEALDMFSRMLKASILPNEITYVGVLCACTHTGMVDRGREFFKNMSVQHRIEPNVAHYGCMVDLLGRAGRLREAYEVIKSMPLKPNSIIWGALLGACRVHKDTNMAETAAKKLLEIEPQNGAVYVSLCNIYAACESWENLREIRKLMMDRGIKKIPGCSLIEMNGFVHEFVAGDESHAQSKEIYLKLDEMTRDLKFAGYLPDTSEVSLDTGEEEKENALYRHSEKLAMAFGLISSGPGVTIRIVKNLRMCVDCHLVAKLVSKVYNREIIVRDKTRYHHFRHGSCSCNEYW